jgi:hypothetical protein
MPLVLIFPFSFFPGTSASFAHGGANQTARW